MSSWSETSAPLPAYQIQPSLSLRAALIGVPILSLVTVLSAPTLPVWLQLLLAAFTLGVWRQAWQHHWPGASQSIAHLQQVGPRACIYWQYNGICVRAEVSDALVTSFLVIIVLTDTHRRRVLVLPADAMPAEAHRCLRRWILVC